MKYTVEKLVGYMNLLRGSVSHPCFIHDYYEDDEYYYISGTSNFVSSFHDCRFSKEIYKNFTKKLSDPFGGIWLEYIKNYNFSFLTKLRIDFPLLERGCIKLDPNLFNGLDKVYILADGMASFFKVCKAEKKKMIELANIDLKKLLTSNSYRNHFEPPYNLICKDNKKFLYTRLNKARGKRQLLIFISDDNSWNFNRSEIVNLESKSGMTYNSIYCAKIILKNNKLYATFFGYNVERDDFKNNKWKIRDKEMIILVESNDGINFTEIECLHCEHNCKYQMTLLGGGLNNLLYLTKKSENDSFCNILNIVKFND